MSLLDMLKRYAFSFYEAANRVDQWRHHAELYSGKGRGLKYDASQQQEILADLVKLGAECSLLDMTSTVDLINHIDAEIRRKRFKEYEFADIAIHLNALHALFGKELQRKICFRIAEDKEKYFQKDNLAGTKVRTAFPSCAGEITNAGNCYALEQNEACVFHCMCALELALQILATELDVNFSGTLDLQNWQNIIENIESAIKNLGKLPKGKYKSETLKFLSGAAMQFRWFKDAWRNHVMHGRDIYDPGKAFSVLDHVREFMEALAEGGLKE